jgi:hypothetical protein
MVRNLSKVSKKDQAAGDAYIAQREAEKMGPRPRSKEEIPPVWSPRTEADRMAEDKALRELMKPAKRRG